MLTVPRADDSNGGWSTRPAAVLLLRALRVAIAGGLLWWAARDVDWAAVRAAVSGASWRWLLAAAALVLVDRVLMAWRWLALLRGVEANRPLQSPALLRVFFVSTFVGTFLPGSVGGDAVRAMSASRHGVTTANAVASVAIDRLLGTISVLLMAVFGLWLVGQQLEDPRVMPVAVLGAALAVTLTALLLFKPGAYERLLRLSGAHYIPMLDRLARKFLAASSQYGRRHGLVANVLAVSVAVQVLRTLQTWCLGLALGLAVGGAWYFAAVPIIVFVTLLPISFAGLGTSNAAFVMLFGMAGVPAADAFILSVLFIALSVLGNLPGGVLVALAGPGATQREA